MQVDRYVEITAPFSASRLHHAAQLRDLRTYAQLGHVASRAELFVAGVAQYTPFVSDESDVHDGHADSVFVNPGDMANAAMRGNGLPNIYGPITLVFSPEALSRSGATIVHFRKNGVYSAAPDGRRELDENEVRNLFAMSWKQLGGGELEIVEGSLKLEDLERVVVEPVTVGGKSLYNEVRTLLRPIEERLGRALSIEVRYHDLRGRAIYDALVVWSEAAPQHNCDVRMLTEPLTSWFAEMRMGQKADQLKRFSDYLAHGTISALRGRLGHLAEHEAATDYANAVQSRDIELQLVEEYFSGADLIALSNEQVRDRDQRLADIAIAHTVLVEAIGNTSTPNSPYDAEDERHEEEANARRDFTDALLILNDWIEETGNGIEGDLSDFMSRSPDGHDSDLASELQGWRDCFRLLDVPDNIWSSDLVDIDWRAVSDYPVTKDDVWG